MRTLRLSLAGTTICGLFAGLIVGSAPLLASQEIVVALDGSGTYTSIADAVEAAVDGDTVLVSPGTYDESILVTRDITIRGDGDAASVVVELSGELPRGIPSWGDAGLPFAFRIEECDATLENLTVRGAASRISVSGGQPTLRDLSFERIGDDYRPREIFQFVIGLEIMDGSTAVLQDSTAIDTDLMIDTGASPTLTGNKLIGGVIFIQDDDVRPIIDDNDFRDSHWAGLWVGGGAKPEISGNTFNGAVDHAVSISDPAFPDGVLRTGTHPLLRGNTIRDCEIGVLLQRGTMATLEDNELHGNRSGITVEGSDLVIAGNAIQGNGVGVVIMRGAPVLTDNLIGQNGAGLVLARPASPSLSGNRICDNETNVRLMKGAEMPEMEGNEVCPDG